jgi:gamma-glutamylcyclotransferase (GGCT)/AIG2-like uncharacterized protein YtfP
VKKRVSRRWFPVFVYGTLRRGEANHGRLAGARYVCRAATAARYELLDLGAFPALTTGGRTAVVGEVYEVDQATLDRLDLLEGHPGFYRRVFLDLAGGLRVQGYVLPRTHPLAALRSVIASGDWKRR